MTRSKVAVALAASALFALALLSPVETVSSDSAIALLVSQSILDHGTTELGVWAGDPSLAYDLDHDPRIRKRGESYHYYSIGVPVLSVPAVWLANRFGLHMLRQEDEFVMQNLLSALCVALAFVLLYRLALCYLAAAAAFVVALVTTAGSSLVSTLGTGLWNSDYAVVFGAMALIAIARHESAEIGRLPTVALALTLALGILARPALVFLALSVLAYLIFQPSRPRRRLVATVLLATAVAAVVATLLGLHLPVPFYYSPAKLLEPVPVLPGILGSLISPSRGILVTSPFVILVLAGVVARFGRLRSEPMLWLMLGWISVHVLAVSRRPMWWGGHSYGTRMLVELMPAFLVLSCLVWRSLGQETRRRQAASAIAYLLLGGVAIAIHAGQGLFNSSVTTWNEQPNIDSHTGLIWSWRYPQFLASNATLEARSIDLQRSRLVPYRLGDVLGPESANAIYRHWYAPEGGWRWSRGPDSEVSFTLDAPGGVSGLGLLELVAGAVGQKEVTLSLNGSPVGKMHLDGFEPQRSAHLIDLGDLAPGVESHLRFEVPEARPTQDDDRILGIALHSIRLRLIPPARDGVVFSDPAFFVEGFSQAEETLRWTDGDRAVFLYPLEVVEAGDCHLEIFAGALGEQKIDVHLNDVPIGRFQHDGMHPASHRMHVPVSSLEPRSLNRIELSISHPRSPPGDTRRLGLAFVSARLAFEEASAAPGSGP